MHISHLISSALLLLPRSSSAAPLGASGIFWAVEAWLQGDCPTTSAANYSNSSYEIGTLGWVDFPAPYVSLNFTDSSAPESDWNFSLSAAKGGGGASVSYIGSLSCANATGWESFRVDWALPVGTEREGPEMKLIEQELRRRV